LTGRPGALSSFPLPESKITAVAIPSDIPNALAFASDLRSSVDEVSGVPGVATGRIKDMPRGNLSGIAIELLFMRLLKLTQKKQCLYGKLLIDVSKALLVLNGFNKDIKITLAWQSPIPKDDLPSIQASIAKLEIGISKATVQRENGYDPEEEEALNDAEDAKNLEKLKARQALLPPAKPETPAKPGQSAPAPGQSGQAPPQGGEL
jgi:hypothetical protein